MDVSISITPLWLPNPKNSQQRIDRTNVRREKLFVENIINIVENIINIVEKK